MSAIQIRPSHPNDAMEIAPLVFSSGPATFNYVFTRHHISAVDFLRRALAKRGGEFGCQDHVTVVASGQIVGVGAIFSPHDAVSYAVHGMQQILRHYGPIRGPGVIRRGLAVERLIQPAKGDLWIIGHLGIDPRRRGQGLGRQLIEHLLDSIRDRGGRRVGLDVSVANPRAEALYARMGFQATRLAKSTLSNQFGTVSDHRRMEMPITPANLD